MLVLLVLIASLGWSYYRAVTAPGSAPLSAKSVEWFKGLPGGTWVTLKVEKIWYTWNKPSVGGSLAGGIPAESPPVSPGAQGPGSHTIPHLNPPPNIPPFVTHPLPNEGVWQSVGKTVKGIPAIRVAFLRPDAQHTSFLGTVMWMDPTLLSTKLVPGTQVPPSAATPPASVQRAQFDALVATFNSGFLLKDSHGGFYLGGHTYAPLVDGQASMVIYKDGTVDIGAWGSEVTMTTQVAAVRQNLAPLVDNGSRSPA